MKCMQMNLSSRLDGQEFLSTHVDRTHSRTIINTIAIVSGILIIASSIVGCVFLRVDLGLLSMILLGVIIISGLLLIAIGVYFCCQRIPDRQIITRGSDIEQARILELSQQLASAQKELVSLRALYSVDQQESNESLSKQQSALLKGRDEHIVQLENNIRQLRKDHAALLKNKDEECQLEIEKQIALRVELQEHHQQELESKERSEQKRIQSLNEEINKQITSYNQDLKEKQQQISDLQQTINQQHDVDLDHIRELETLVKEKETIIRNLQCDINYYKNPEPSVHRDSLPAVSIRIRQHEDRIALLETVNPRLNLRTRNRSSSI
ncbi:IncA family protein [Chlamydia sp. 12-01]|uniref:IncA family protein n=1 Tax=Chlamydia sp. 12-01 TaxID=3002742 RepID=UPI0035D5023A